MTVAEIEALRLRGTVLYFLSQIMKTAGLSQADVAALVGWSQSAVSQAVGRQSNMTLDRVATLFAALGYRLTLDLARIEPSKER